MKKPNSAQGCATYKPSFAGGNLLQTLKRGIRAGMNVKKPEMLARALKARILGSMGRVVPKHVYIALTYTCNLNCNHCFASKMRVPDEKPLNYDEYRDLVRQAERMGVYGFDFTGGEAFLRDDIVDVIKLFNPKRNTLSIVSNATKITRPILVELQKAGLDTLSISLDSGIPEEHDLFRHRTGLYDQAVQALRWANEVGLKSMICVTVLNETIRTESFLSLVKLSKELNAVLNVNYGAQVGNWSDKEDIAFSEENKRYLFSIIKDNPHVSREEFFSYQWGCQAMKELIYVTAYGEVMPCPYIHISFGNIRNEPLETIYKRALEFDLFRRYAPVCLTGEDEDFIRQIMDPANKAEKDPVDYRLFEKEIVSIGEKYWDKKKNQGPKDRNGQ
jgi:MoaA/NifB/PqqE/SkfB family radical SAM enzyme